MEGRDLGNPADALSDDVLYCGVVTCWRVVIGSGIDGEKSGLGGGAVIEEL